jgi:hypothetical protein
MRYSLIHHDVREKFGLTVGDYLVCDSIHQLSYGAPTNRPNTQIAKFLGVDEGTVRHAKVKLLKLGLVMKVGDGFSTTPLWSEAVTFARNNSELISEKNRPSIMNIDKKAIAEPIASSSRNVRVVKVDKDGKEKPPPVKRDPTAWNLRQRLYKRLEEDTGKYPTPHTGDYVRLRLALSGGLTEQDCITLFEDALSNSKKKIRTVRQAFTAHEIDSYRQDYL